VISDIHSNYAAFESAFNTIKKINPDGIIFLGDYVTDFPYPQRTMEILYKSKSAYNCWFIRGNREDYLLQHRKNSNDGWCHSSSVGSFLYTYENLTEDDLVFFSNMPICQDIKIDGASIITA
ncbi:MAG: metallophosphoesterase, partial [Oscillospiraceae bacterium]|nr:metallophosphoesterase [Oscillospiraceae bacterium]